MLGKIEIILKSCCSLIRTFCLRLPFTSINLRAGGCGEVVGQPYVSQTS